MVYELTHIHTVRLASAPYAGMHCNVSASCRICAHSGRETAGEAGESLESALMGALPMRARLQVLFIM
eukprot:1160488-Pelagomonas_calceolata.AAC.3